MARPTPSLSVAGAALLLLAGATFGRADDAVVFVVEPPANAVSAEGDGAAAEDCGVYQSGTFLTPPGMTCTTDMTCTGGPTGVAGGRSGDGPTEGWLAPWGRLGTALLPSRRPEAADPDRAAIAPGGRRAGPPRWFGGPWVVTHHPYTDPNDPDRHTGWGDPLIGTSWRNRPFSVSGFVGGAIPNTPVDGGVRSRGGTALGYRVGYDFDHYLGVELRHTFLATDNVLIGVVDADGNAVSREGLSQIGDVMIHAYPWGDSRWRPYLGVGLGVGSFELIDANAVRYRETSLVVPIAFGLKYQVWPCLAVRAEIADLIGTGGSTLDPENFLNLNVGAEFRFGARPPKYYPFDTARWRW